MTRFWRRRASRQRWLYTVLGAVIFVAVAGASVTIGTDARQPDLAVRAGLAASSADNNSMAWTRSLASNASAQDTSTRAQLTRAFDGAPIAIQRSVVGDPVTLASGAAALPLEDGAALRAATTGMPALSHGEAAIDDAGAAELHLGVGDLLSVSTASGSRQLRIVSVWHASNPRSPIWNGIGRGAFDTSARIALSGTDLAKGQIPLTARWSVSPDLSRVRVRDLSALETGYARLAAEPLKMSAPAQLVGGGADTIAALSQGVATADAVVPVAIALLAAGAVLAILLLTRLLTEVRVEETALLRSRGASRAQIIGGDVRGALLPAIVATLAGAIAAQLVLYLFVSGPTGWVEVLVPTLSPAAVALASVALSSSSVTLVGVRRRAVAVVGVVSAALLTVIALIGVYRLLSAGVGADPAAELAPALVIAALVVIGLLVGPSLAALADRLFGPRHGIPTPLAIRRIRWRPGLVAGALVLVALSVGASGFAASTVPSSGNFLRDSGRLVTGGDLDVQLPGDASIIRGAAQTSVDRMTRAAGAEAAAPALLEQVELADVSTTLAAAPVQRMAALQNHDLADLGALTTTVAAPIGIALPTADSAAELRLGLTVAAASAPADMRVRVTAWIVRPGDGVVRVDFPEAALGHDLVQASLAGRGPGRLVAIEASVRSSGAVGNLVVGVKSVTMVRDGHSSRLALPARGWGLTKAVPAAPGTTATGALGWASANPVDARGSRADLGRLMPEGPAVLPIAISDALSTTSGFELGSVGKLTSDSTVSFTVTAIVSHTIGATADAGVWADLPTLQTVLLRVSNDVPRAADLWLTAGNAYASTARISASEPAAVVTESPALALAPLTLPVTVGTIAAAVGMLLFALLGIATFTTSLMRARHEEIAVLRALGASVRTQRIASRIEFIAVVGYAVVLGGVAAVVAVALTAPPLARASASGIAPGLRPAVAVDPVILGPAILLLVAGALVALIAQEMTIARVAGRPGTEVQR